MIKLLFGSTKMVNSIASKILNRIFKKTLGLASSKVEVKDLNIIDDVNDKVTIHINGEIQISKEELMKFINDRLPD